MLWINEYCIVVYCSVLYVCMYCIVLLLGLEASYMWKSNVHVGLRCSRVMSHGSNGEEYQQTIPQLQSILIMIVLGINEYIYAILRNNTFFTIQLLSVVLLFLLINLSRPLF